LYCRCGSTCVGCMCIAALYRCRCHRCFLYYAWLYRCLRNRGLVGFLHICYYGRVIVAAIALCKIPYTAKHKGNRCGCIQVLSPQWQEGYQECLTFLFIQAFLQLQPVLLIEGQSLLCELFL